MNKIEHILAGISEESHELGKEAMKTARFGYDDRDPNNLGAGMNYEKMFTEFSQLCAMMELFADELQELLGHKPVVYIDMVREAKRRAFWQYLQYSALRGTYQLDPYDSSSNMLVAPPSKEVDALVQDPVEITNSITPYYVTTLKNGQTTALWLQDVPLVKARQPFIATGWYIAGIPKGYEGGLTYTLFPHTVIAYRRVEPAVDLTPEPTATDPSIKEDVFVWLETDPKLEEGTMQDFTVETLTGYVEKAFWVQGCRVNQLDNQTGWFKFREGQAGTPLEAFRMYDVQRYKAGVVKAA